MSLHEKYSSHTPKILLYMKIKQVYVLELSSPPYPRICPSKPFSYRRQVGITLGASTYSYIGGNTDKTADLHFNDHRESAIRDKSNMPPTDVLLPYDREAICE